MFNSNPIFRPRKTMKHLKTGMKFRWPEEDTLRHIQFMGCNLTPMGCNIPKKDVKNTDYSIEWEVGFARAEQYLSRNFRHPKIRVYLFALLMLKCHFGQLSGLEVSLQCLQ